MFNNKKIIKNLKFYYVIGMFFLLMISIFNYAQLIGFTEIKNVKIIGNEFIEISEIESQFSISENDDLLTYNISDAQKNISQLNYIKSCRISRIFPSTLLIEIIENNPIAHVKTLDNEFIMDVDGTPIPFNPYAVSYFSLPQVKLNKSMDVSNNIEFEITKDFGFKLNFLQKNYPQIFNGISTFNFSNQGVVEMNFDSNTKIFVRENYLDYHFKILEEFKEIKHSLSFYSVIDLRVKDQLIVKENKLKKS